MEDKTAQVTETATLAQNWLGSELLPQNSTQNTLKVPLLKLSFRTRAPTLFLKSTCQQSTGEHQTSPKPHVRSAARGMWVLNHAVVNRLLDLILKSTGKNLTA